MISPRRRAGPNRSSNDAASPARAFDTFHRKDGKTYLVFKRTPRGGYHVFAEVEAKDAAHICGSSGKGTTDKQWGELWKARAKTR